MFKLPNNVRANYWDREKRAKRIKLLMQVCESWLREKRANEFYGTIQTFYSIHGVEYKKVYLPASYLELKKQLEEEQKPLTSGEQELLNTFEIQVTNALSNGMMLEVKDFQKNYDKNFRQRNNTK